MNKVLPETKHTHTLLRCSVQVRYEVCDKYACDEAVVHETWDNFFVLIERTGQGADSLRSDKRPVAIAAENKFLSN